jgi:hypothetical protein
MAKYNGAITKKRLPCDRICHTGLIISSPKKGGDTMNTLQIRARFPDESACRQFLNQSFGRIDVCAPIALVKSLIPFAEKPRDQDSMNVASANGNLR